MSGLGPGYNPKPPRAWYRVQIDVLNNPADYQVKKKMLLKGNILQYKKNSSSLVKVQGHLSPSSDTKTSDAIGELITNHLFTNDDLPVLNVPTTAIRKFSGIFELSSSFPIRSISSRNFPR